MPMYNLLEYSDSYRDSTGSLYQFKRDEPPVGNANVDEYLLPKINITNYNVMIDGINFYDQPINSQIRKYDEVRKIATGKGDNYATGCLIDYKYFKDVYQLVAIDLSKQK